ncbi:MAG: phage head morphogenesis protein [Caldilineales bacterium]|nr:phage head morphogenesis protein [Caldilineales bacterium]
MWLEPPDDSLDDSLDDFLDDLPWAAWEAYLWQAIAADLLAAFRLTALALLLRLLTADRQAQTVPLVDQLAAAWLQNYGLTLVKDLNATTRRQLRQALAAYLTNPNRSYADLQQTLTTYLLAAPTRGRLPAATRAELIASTELTRARTAGLLQAAALTGLTVRTPAVQPPLHPRCRCHLEPFPADPQTIAWRWYTAADERVCPQCAPLHGQEVGEAVPAHAATSGPPNAPMTR